MKQLSILFIGILISITSFAQHTVTIKHKQYQTIFDTVLKYPVAVRWVVTKKSLSCLTKYPRSNRFVPDPLLYKQTNIEADYVKSGYDRGHNFPAADGGCDSTAMRESFFFSNMTPQDPSINRGDWKDLEEFTRNIALVQDSVKVWCGSWGVKKKIGRVTVPTDCWKVIYIVKTKQWVAYHFENSPSINLGLKAREVPLSYIQKQTKLKFK